LLQTRRGLNSRGIDVESRLHTGQGRDTEKERRRIKCRVNEEVCGRRAVPISEEGRRAISRAKVGNTCAAGHSHSVSEEQKRAQSEFMKGNEYGVGHACVHTEETKHLLSRALMGNANAKGNRGRLGQPQSIEERCLRSESLKAAWEAKSPEEKDRLTRRVVEGNRRRPTEPERFLGSFLEQFYPGEWAYNGDGSQGLVIGGKVPDYINVNGEKEVVEVFGSYYHDPEFFPNRLTEEELVKHYAKCGFKCYIFWDWECYDSEKLLRSLGGDVGCQVRGGHYGIL
ncbi:hypothetical protein LCGC14_1838220, partial [marine sediment metagenome]